MAARAGIRIPSLDGARAFSALLVIAFHTGLSLYVPFLWRLKIGVLGVRIFFVISGFIITALLLREHDGAGTIDLRRFYVRRALRIFPPYYVMLAVTLSLAFLGIIAAPISGIWPSAIYASDYLQRAPVVGHTWSLSVEEQFYLLWPTLLLLFGRSRAVVGCAMVLMAAPVFHILAERGVWPTDPGHAFECVADQLAAGCLLALLRERLWASAWYRRLVSSSFAIAPFCGLLAIEALLGHRGLMRDLLVLPALNIAIAVALDHYMRFPSTIGGRVLNARPIVWLGLMSYSIYLWQQIFARSELLLWEKLIGIFACAAASYYLIELPSQAFKRRRQAREESVLNARAVVG